MRTLTEPKKNELITDIRLLLKHAVGDEYYPVILDSHDGVGRNGSSVLADIIQNVLECSDWVDKGCYTESDIRMAISRVLMERIGIDYEYHQERTQLPTGQKG